MTHLKFGIIVDIQAALELALGGNGGTTANKGSSGGIGGLNMGRIDPVAVVRNAYEAHGVKSIELPADANYIVPGILTKPETIKGLQEVREELDLEYTVHLPYIQLALCSMNPHIRKASIDTQVETIKACEQIGGINNYILHLTGDLEDQIGAFNVPRHYKELAWGLLLDKGMDSVEEIISKTEIDPSKICIENNEGVPFSDMYDILIDELDTSICFDIGHCILQREEDPKEFMTKWKGKVHEIHLHNVLYSLIRNRIHVYEDHRGLVQGIIDIPDFLDHLKDIEYSHPILLEIMSQKEIAESLAMLRKKGYINGN